MIHMATAERRGDQLYTGRVSLIQTDAKSERNTILCLFYGAILAVCVLCVAMTGD